MKRVVLYNGPEDVDGFDARHLAVHAPLVEALAGLERWESTRVVGAADQGEQRLHRIAELYFKDRESLETALGSVDGRDTARDYRRIAPREVGCSAPRSTSRTLAAG
ncbi:EthD family reductase [Streptomyces sp. NBC_01518]|uniref:EthD family reductase n=1 Tax=Streptomyces sp. NBC_01518 TaxID=2903891 RepID=UPI0038636460